MTKIAAGQHAPDFSVKGLDGREYRLSEMLKKGPVLAAFFKISCPVCQFTFPFLERMFHRYGGADVTFLGISQDGARDSKEFATEYGVTFPMALDEKEYPASNAYGLTSVPTIFLIDTDGMAKFSSMGFTKSDLEGIAGELANRGHVAPAALFQANESVPAHKPG